MGIFKRRRKSESVATEQALTGPYSDDDNVVGLDPGEQASTAGAQDSQRSAARGPETGGAHAAPDDGGQGPYDASEAPQDEMPRLDLGSVRVPIPDGSQLQVEMDPQGPLRAVHLMTPIGQFTVNAFAAPRSGGLWNDISDELLGQLRTDGATVRRVPGEWGDELAATMQDMTLRFLGVDGPRWMLRGVVAGPHEHAEYAENLLRDIVRYTVVDRGEQPFPAREPLPVILPQELAEHIDATRAEQAGEQGGQQNVQA